MHITAATQEQSPDLIPLVNLAGNGLPYYLWQIMSDGPEAPMDTGRNQISKDSGRYSYSHTRTCMEGNTVAGLCISYELSEQPNLDMLHNFPDPMIPFVMLEAKAPPKSWFINALTVAEPYRHQGIATRLLQDAEALAQKHGAKELSSIVNSQNRAALNLYSHLGFYHQDQMAVVHYPGCDADSRWMLMVKPL